MLCVKDTSRVLWECRRSHEHISAESEGGHDRPGRWEVSCVRRQLCGGETWEGASAGEAEKNQDRVYQSGSWHRTLGITLKLCLFVFFKWLLSFQDLDTKLFGPNYVTKATDLSFERISPGIIRETAMNRGNMGDSTLFEQEDISQICFIFSYQHDFSCNCT